MTEAADLTGSITIPGKLAATWRGKPAGEAWLAQLPAMIATLQRRWSLSLGTPFDNGMCAWVAPATTRDGTAAVLKIGIPHMEANDEIAALRFWAGDPTARLIDADEAYNAMLLEQCIPGHSLHVLAEPEQDAVIARLLKRLWRRPPAQHPFRGLSVMTRHWIDSSRVDAHRWPDAGLVREGLRLMEELARTTPNDVLLATDLHAGNVLAAAREPWLVIDPKPFLGDPAYDATQHLLNCPERLALDPMGLVRRFSDLLDVEYERVKLWMFARIVAEPRDIWKPVSETARALAPS